MNNDLKGSILVVDDNEQNLEVIAGILSESDYDFALESNGEEAIKFAQSQFPDLILLDIMMPGIDGFEVCERLKKEDSTKDIPVIFLTARTEIDDILKGFNAGGVDYISKPFKKEELLIRIKNHIELIKAKKELIEINRTKDLLYAIIAHDLRGSVGLILSWIKLIDDKDNNYGENEKSEIIELLHGSAESTFALLENLLEWASLNTRTLIFAPQDQKLYPIVMEVLNFLSGLLSNKSINMSFNIDQNLTGYFDEKTISTVLRNLISNAIKFSKTKGEIKVNAFSENDKIIIKIEDDGVGISKEKIASVFDVDQMKSTRGTYGEKGTGLGLKLCKDLVEKNGGKIWADSDVGKGTSFYFSLPVHKQ